MKPLRTTLCVVFAVAVTVAVRADRKVGTTKTDSVRSAGLQASQASQQHPSAAVLSKYCITCHNAKRKTAGLAIDTLDLARMAADAEVWEKIARKFRTHEMPPPRTVCCPEQPELRFVSLAGAQ